MVLQSKRWIDVQTNTLFLAVTEGSTFDSAAQLNALRVVVPQVDTLVSINGAKGVAFRNVAFLHTRDTMPMFRYDATIAIEVPAVTFTASSSDSVNWHRQTAAVAVRASSEIAFEQCQWLGIGNIALQLSDSVRQAVVRDSRFVAIESTCFNVANLESAASTAMISDITFENNYVAGCGGYYGFNGAGVRIEHARNVVVTRNTFKVSECWCE